MQYFTTHTTLEKPIVQSQENQMIYHFSLVCLEILWGTFVCATAGGIAATIIGLWIKFVVR